MIVFFVIMSMLQLFLSFATFVIVGGFVVFKKRFCRSYEDDVEDDCGYLEQIIKEQGR